MSPPRLPPIPPAEQSPEQAKLHEQMAAVNHKAFGNLFQTTNEQGAMLGPYSTLLYAPQVAQAYLGLGVANSSLNSPLTPRQVELGVLATLGISRLQPTFPLYAHRSVAAGPNVGLTAAQIDAAVGQDLDDSNPSRSLVAFEHNLTQAGIDDPEELAVCVFARAVALHAGRIEDRVWDRAEHVLGKQKCATVVHLVSWYSYASILMNAVKAEVPPSR